MYKQKIVPDILNCYLLLNLLRIIRDLCMQLQLVKDKCVQSKAFQQKGHVH